MTRTAQHFKLSLPLAYPSDSDSREFVDIAIDDLCPQYSSMKPSGTGTPTSSQPPPVPYVGNPHCGGEHGTRSSYLCDEKMFLTKLDEDHVAVPDPVAMIKSRVQLCLRDHRSRRR